MGRMDGRVVIVTGASLGIGRACAFALAREGAKVVVADLLDDPGREAASSLVGMGLEALFVHTDVSKTAEVEGMVEQTLKHWGRLDFACNNAGVEGKLATTVECSEENWDRTLAINLKGVWLCMKHEIPAMLAAGGGAIVNMSSVGSSVGFESLPAYCASKGGVDMLTRVAALEYARSKVRVNAVCPGVIRTAMFDRAVGGQPAVEAQYLAMEPVGRLGTPEEVAAAVVFLCSDEAAFVTGHMLVVDGGLVAR